MRIGALLHDFFKEADICEELVYEDEFLCAKERYEVIFGKSIFGRLEISTGNTFSVRNVTILGQFWAYMAKIGTDSVSECLRG